MSAFRMPSLGADMEAGKLVEWLKAPGDPVRLGDVVAVVETQKGAIEIEIFEDGILDRPLVDLGATVPVGTPLAKIRKEGEAEPAPSRPAAAKAAPAAEAAPAAAAPAVEVAAPAQAASKPAPPPAAPPRPGRRQRTTPAARRRAAQAGIDLAKVAPGPGGAVTLRDLAAAAAPP